MGYVKKLTLEAVYQLRGSLLTVAYWKMNKRRVHVNICITKERPILNSLKNARRICTKNTRARGVLITYIISFNFLQSKQRKLAIQIRR